MAKILTFRNNGDASSGQDFLTDENQTLSFRRSKDGGISLGDIRRTGLSDLFPNPKRNWSNQELADLFRVSQLLSSANVPVETDRGVTDEGDPWFVFCHVNGEVFIHLCRIDGTYILDSPNVLRPLRGADFNELIADFTNQTLPARRTEEDDERRVIRLERGGKIRLHPSAMLAALIWTLFIAAEELVLLAPEEDHAHTNTDTLLNFEGMVPVRTTETAEMSIVFEDGAVDVSRLLKSDTLGSEDTPEAQVQIREVIQQQGLTAQHNAFGLGLSTIAIAMGFMSEAVLLENQRKVLDDLKNLGFSEYKTEAEQIAELDIPVDIEERHSLKMLVEFLKLDLPAETEMPAAETPDTDRSSTHKALLELVDQHAEVDAQFSPIKVDGLNSESRDNSSTELRLEVDDATPHDPNLLVTYDGKEEQLAQTSPTALGMTLSKIVETWLPKMEEFQFGQTTLQASFDVSETDAFALFELLDEPQNADLGPDVEDFETIAQRMFEFLQNKSSDFGVVELKSGSGIVFVDRTAVNQGELHYMHWEASDGKIISLIGLEADFQQFDMIA